MAAENQFSRSKNSQRSVDPPYSRQCSTGRAYSKGFYAFSRLRQWCWFSAGLVLGILIDVRVSLIEVDKRKAAFLRQVKHAVDVPNIEIINQRIENASITADVTTARALAPLAKLLELSELVTQRDGCRIFLKGREYENEISEARSTWNFDVTSIPSRTDATARILKITEASRV